MFVQALHKGMQQKFTNDTYISANDRFMLQVANGTIELKNIHRSLHGSDTGIYDRDVSTSQRGHMHDSSVAVSVMHFSHAENAVLLTSVVQHAMQLVLTCINSSPFATNHCYSVLL
jgi:hypothetical protein